MSSITRFSRTSGRNLGEVRRARKVAAPVDLAAMKKAELVTRAEAAGLDTSGTKAALVERLSTPETNDADVETRDA
jgi:hypothetical protein